MTINEFIKFKPNGCIDFKEYDRLISSRNNFQKKLLRLNNKRELLEDKASAFSEQDDRYKKCLKDLLKLNEDYRKIINKLNDVEVKLLSCQYE